MWRPEAYWVCVFYAQARAKAAVPSTQPERTSPHTSDGGTAKQLAVSTTTAHQSDRAHEGDSEEVTSLRERLLVSEAQAEALQGEVAAVRERLATFVSAAREAATALQGSEGASPEVLAPFLCVLRDAEVLYTDQQAHQPSVAKIRLLQVGNHLCGTPLQCRLDSHICIHTFSYCPAMVS